MLYQNIVESFIKNIENGTILPGEKLPSLRKISDQFDVSLSTAVEAYRKLELFGYVTAKDRSGYVARIPSGGDSVLLPSKKFQSRLTEIDHIDEIIQLINQTMDHEIAPFGVGTPEVALYPHKMLNKYLSRMIRLHPQASSSYIFGLGLEELRAELARWTRPFVGVTSKEKILITNGCLEAINLALGAECNVGDIVAIESPCYFGLLHAIHHHGLKAIEVRTDPKEGIDPVSLEDLAKKNKIRALISTPNAQNPLGFTVSDERKKQVLAICKKYKIRLIENDIYGELSYESKRPKTYKNFDKDEIVTYCSSFSKFLGPGLRLGWCVIAGDTAPYLRQKLSLNLSTASFTQHVVQGILRNEDLTKVSHSMADHYKKNVQIYSNVFQSLMGDRLILTQPTGSYFLWARVQDLDSRSAYQKAKKHKISFAPGPIFSACGHYNNYLRLNCAHEFNDKRRQELTTLSKILIS